MDGLIRFLINNFQISKFSNYIQIKSKLGLSQQFSSTSSSSGIEQESLPTVSSSVGATRVRHTQM